MAGFDPFAPAPAWPQDLTFAGSPWSGEGASYVAGSAALEFGAKETVSPLELHEQFFQDQLQSHMTHGLNFQVDGAVESALMAGTMDSVLNMPSAPMLRGGSNDISGSGSEEPQFLLEEQQVPTPTAWLSALSQISSLLDETSQNFGFDALNNGDLQKPCNPDGDNCPQLGNVQSAPLQLHDDVKHNNGEMLSFAPGQQLNRDFDTLKEFSGLHHLNLSSLLSGQLSAFNATGVAVSPKQSNEVINGLTGTSFARSEAPNGNVAAVSGAPKPRLRARRGQATDPHSIAERLRREKISDRMKDLQELVPNSNKTDKASMLDEIIDYVKFLQLQVKVLSMSRLGATEAVVPLLTESQTESSALLPSPKSGSRKEDEDVLEQSELGDGVAFEQEVAQLMENNMTSAMQYLQSKGLCLMPIALASAMSDKKGTSSAAVRPESDGTEADGGKRRVKKVPDVPSTFGVSKEMKSRA